MHSLRSIYYHFGRCHLQGLNDTVVSCYLQGYNNETPSCHLQGLQDQFPQMTDRNWVSCYLWANTQSCHMYTVQTHTLKHIQSYFNSVFFFFQTLLHIPPHYITSVHYCALVCVCVCVCMSVYMRAWCASNTIWLYIIFEFLCTCFCWSCKVWCAHLYWFDTVL